MADDPARRRLLGRVRALGLRDGWIGAGFVRDAVWDALHGRPPSPAAGDVDVVWFDLDRADRAEDERLEAVLREMEPAAWSVRNQARMHGRNGDAPYASTPDAMWHWPDTATAVAVRRLDDDGVEIAAPFGLDDLFGLLLRPGPCFLGPKYALHLERVRRKRWHARWPRLRSEPGNGQAALPAAQPLDQAHWKL